MYNESTNTVFGIHTSYDVEDILLNQGTVMIQEVYNTIATAIQNTAS